MFAKLQYEKSCEVLHYPVHTHARIHAVQCTYLFLYNVYSAYTLYKYVYTQDTNVSSTYICVEYNKFIFSREPTYINQLPILKK